MRYQRRLRQAYGDRRMSDDRSQILFNSRISFPQIRAQATVSNEKIGTLLQGK